MLNKSEILNFFFFLIFGSVLVGEGQNKTSIRRIVCEFKLKRIINVSYA